MSSRAAEVGPTPEARGERLGAWFFLAALLFHAATKLWGIATPLVLPHSGGEMIMATFGRNYNWFGYGHGPLGQVWCYSGFASPGHLVIYSSHPPTMSVLLGLLFRFLGESDWALRLPTIASSTMLVLGVRALLRRVVGEPWGGVGALLAASSAVVAFFGRSADLILDMPSAAALAWTAWAFLRYLDAPIRRNLLLLCAILFAGLACEWSIAFALPVPVLLGLRRRKELPALAPALVGTFLLWAAIYGSHILSTGALDMVREKLTQRTGAGEKTTPWTLFPSSRMAAASLVALVSPWLPVAAAWLLLRGRGLLRRAALPLLFLVVAPAAYFLVFHVYFGIHPYLVVHFLPAAMLLLVLAAAEWWRSGASVGRWMAGALVVTHLIVGLGMAAFLQARQSSRISVELGAFVRGLPPSDRFVAFSSPEGLAGSGKPPASEGIVSWYGGRAVMMGTGTMVRYLEMCGKASIEDVDLFLLRPGDPLEPALAARLESKFRVREHRGVTIVDPPEPTLLSAFRRGGNSLSGKKSLDALRLPPEGLRLEFQLLERIPPSSGVGRSDG
jgi:hypothetical protein